MSILLKVTKATLDKGGTRNEFTKRLLAAAPSTVRLGLEVVENDEAYLFFDKPNEQVEAWFKAILAGEEKLPELPAMPPGNPRFTQKAYDDYMAAKKTSKKEELAKRAKKNPINDLFEKLSKDIKEKSEPQPEEA